MLMKVALNSSSQLVSIKQVERGLACQCFCFECGESVIAKKGEINEHHFAHASNKESCHIHPESILHKYAKEVIMAEQKIYLPELSNGSHQKGKLYQFHTIQPEQSVGYIRPDLIAINDDEMVFIEIAVTSFIGDEKREFINKLGIKTIEIDLSAFVDMELDIPNQFLHDYIVNHLDNKTWIYTKQMILPTNNDKAMTNLPTTIQKPSFELFNFTIYGYWVEVRLFESGMLAVKLVTFNHDLVNLLKQWRNEGGGKYDGKYKSWNYFKPFSATVLKRLQELHDLGVKSE